MKISLILAHPDHKSFNHAIAAAALETLDKNKHSVWFHDLYREQFDPLLPVEELPKDARLPPETDKHCAEIAAADGIIIVHPNRKMFPMVVVSSEAQRTAWMEGHGINLWGGKRSTTSSTTRGTTAASVQQFARMV